MTSFHLFVLVRAVIRSSVLVSWSARQSFEEAHILQVRAWLQFGLDDAWGLTDRDAALVDDLEM